MTKDRGFEGIARAVGGAAAAAVGVGDDDQLDLLSLAPPSRLPAGDRRSGLEAQIREAAAVRRRGRPNGAQNIATKQAKAWITRMFGDPMIESARWLLHTPASMAAELDCTLVEAFDRQQRIREALLPFLHAKLAPVGEDGRALPLFQLIMGGLEVGEPVPAPWLTDPEVMRTIESETQRNQGVSAEPDDQSQTAEVAK